MSPEQISATRNIPAPAADIFAILADPARHHDTEPSDWVRDAVDAEPITAVGQTFNMNMYLQQIGGAYVMENLVSVFEPDRAIAWRPGMVGPDGTATPGGWQWRYDLTPGDGETEVTLTYDWSEATPEARANVPQWPPFPQSYLEKSLAALERAATS